MTRERVTTILGLADELRALGKRRGQDLKLSLSYADGKFRAALSAGSYEILAVNHPTDPEYAINAVLRLADSGAGRVGSPHE